ncbi:MAG TPA: response regulator [Planctomycetaceae bacterium]|nr:response regulator [Planctomycetaceae bacterium]
MTGNKPMRLLIVDDEPGMLRTLRRIMMVKGFEVETAASGEEAVERTRAWRPDCILMDIRMPGMNGVEAFRQIRERSPATRVVFMTAYAGSSLVDEALNEGGLAVFPKPLDIDALCEQIAAAAAERPLLVVDDDQAFCQSLARVLAAKGFDVRTVHRVAEAIETFRQRPRGVVLLDMKLNGSSGLELLKQLREINPDIVAILMTGFADLEPLMRQAAEDGVRECFIKPIDIDRLLETIE